MSTDLMEEYRSLERAAAVLISHARAELPADRVVRIGAFIVAIVDELVAGCSGDARKLAEALHIVHSGLDLFLSTHLGPGGADGAANGADRAGEKMHAIHRRAAPRADRTMDEMMEDLEAIDDIARGFLASMDGETTP